MRAWVCAYRIALLFFGYKGGGGAWCARYFAQRAVMALNITTDAAVEPAVGVPRAAKRTRTRTRASPHAQAPGDPFDSLLVLLRDDEQHLRANPETIQRCIALLRQTPRNAPSQDEIQFVYQFVLGLRPGETVHRGPLEDAFHAAFPTVERKRAKKVLNQILGLRDNDAGKLVCKGADGSYVRQIGTTECTVCTERIANDQLEICLPCRHACVCASCLRELQHKACPMCRRPIESTVQWAAVYHN